MPGPLPERWLNCPSISSQLFIDKFVAFKTPLDDTFNSQIPPELRFSPQSVFDFVKSQKRKLGLWIDLTKTKRFYNKTEIESRGCAYAKVECHGHEGAPTVDQTKTVLGLCQRFSQMHPTDVIAVHCTHGFNRTGFLLAAYIVEHMDYAVNVAVREFSKVRWPGIYKGEYIRELFIRYDDEKYAINPPPLPDWCFEGKAQSSRRHLENEGNCRNAGDESRKKSRIQGRYKANPLFMDGVPGVEAVQDHADIDEIRGVARRLANYDSDLFPGSQPVSMDRENLQLLSDRPYKVSWKADGTRYMLLIWEEGKIYFLDRDNSVFKVMGLKFYSRSRKSQPLCNTLLDGEMVIDIFRGKNWPRFLVYDIVALEDERIGNEPFYPTRLKAIESEIIQPRVDAMKEGKITREAEPFGVRAKAFFDIRDAASLLGEKFAKKLTHQPDGLIFQPCEDPYKCGQTPEVLKWKPPTMNSIDFKLVIKPETRVGYVNRFIGCLLTTDGEIFGEIKYTKKLRDLNGKIIECKHENGQWVFMRERTDKSFPNSRATANAVYGSIRHPITKEMLLNFIETDAYHVFNPLEGSSSFRNHYSQSSSSAMYSHSSHHGDRDRNHDHEGKERHPFSFS